MTEQNPDLITIHRTRIYSTSWDLMFPSDTWIVGYAKRLTEGMPAVYHRKSRRSISPEFDFEMAGVYP